MGSEKKERKEKQKDKKKMRGKRKKRGKREEKWGGGQKKETKREGVGFLGLEERGY